MFANSDYDEIDRSALKDVVSIIKGDDDDDNEQSSVASEGKDNQEPQITEAISEAKLPEDSNENTNNKKQKKNKKSLKTKKAAEPVDDEPELKIPEKNIELTAINNVTTPMTEAKKLIQNNREKNASHNLTISEAFADDDVIEEFKAEKVSLLILNDLILICPSIIYTFIPSNAYPSNKLIRVHLFN